MGNPSPSEITAAHHSAPTFRELTAIETDHVSGGIIPVVLAAAVIAVAIIENSGDDSTDDSAQDDG